jgi:hydrogenase maturation protein HypF
VQGVGFRPFIYRLARENTLAGWVLNGAEGVEIHLEGAEPSLDAFVRDLKTQAPSAAHISEIAIERTVPEGLLDFTIRNSERAEHPTVRISPDLAVCATCLEELFDPTNPRYGYPYINCTNCGPRYSVVLRLPYDRCNTTMQCWALDDYCTSEYHDPGDRRFHAQPVACPACGPNYFLQEDEDTINRAEAAINRAAQLLCEARFSQLRDWAGTTWHVTQGIPLLSRQCASVSSERKSPSP